MKFAICHGDKKLISTTAQHARHVPTWANSSPHHQLMLAGRHVAVMLNRGGAALTERVSPHRKRCVMMFLLNRQPDSTEPIG